MIHPTAIIDPKAELADGVEVGPSAVIEAGVTIGERTKIGPMVHIQGTTTIGADNVIHTAATIGFPPQYLGFSGAPTRLIIGDRNVIREYVSIHRSLKDDTATIIGNDCFLMGFSHVAHDCRVGDGVILANGALLAGHVSVGDRAFVSGNAAIHQFCRVGRLVMVGGLAKVTKDVPPFIIADGNPARLRGLNLVGLRRAGFPAHVRMELKRLLRKMYASNQTLSQVIAGITLTDHSAEGREFVEFYRDSKRGMTGPLFSTSSARTEPDEQED